MNFIKDEEKMRDFLQLSPQEFLSSYSYLTEEEYANTSTLWNQYIVCTFFNQLLIKEGITGLQITATEPANFVLTKNNVKDDEHLYANFKEMTDTINTYHEDYINSVIDSSQVDDFSNLARQFLDNNKVLKILENLTPKTYSKFVEETKGVKIDYSTLINEAQKFLKSALVLQEYIPKLQNFANYCQDCSYRGIDAAIPHCSGITAKHGNVLTVKCEKYVPEIDDYVDCKTEIKNDGLIESIAVADFSSDDVLLNCIKEVEDKIDWNEVDLELSLQEEKLSLPNLPNDEDIEILL